MCVPESQRAEYQRRIDHDTVGLACQKAFSQGRLPRVITHPDAVKGLTPKLNWIFDNVSDDEAIVFVDDDITSIERCFTERGEIGTIRDPQMIGQIIRNTFLLARDMEAFYFGWEASNGAVRYYTGFKPISLTGYINGCAMGFRTGHGLRFDERIVAKNDFDIAALNAWKHRYCVKDCRYTFCQKETFIGLGGQAAFRTSQTEKNDVALLRKKYGDIFSSGGHSGVRKRDYAGAQKITMHLPF